MRRFYAILVILYCTTIITVINAKDNLNDDDVIVTPDNNNDDNDGGVSITFTYIYIDYMSLCLLFVWPSFINCNN